MDSTEESRLFQDYYRIGKVLGDGNFSVVHECQEIATGKSWAVKCIKKSILNPVDVENIQREMQVLRQLNHPNIVQLVDVFDSELDDMCYMVMELVTGGELFDRIIAKESYTELEAKFVVKTVAQVLAYCHERGVAHRDLKPENLLYDTPDELSMIKIADFGFAKMASEGVVMSTMCGTPGYFAPEVIARQPYEHKCDIWSLGVITYILLSGFPPFYNENQIKEMEKIRAADYDFPAPYFDSVSPEAKQFIRQLLVVDAEKRLSAQEVLDHPWVSEATDSLSESKLKAVPQLKHVSSNLAENRSMIHLKFKASVDVILALNRSKKLADLKKNDKTSASSILHQVDKVTIREEIDCFPFPFAVETDTFAMQHCARITSSFVYSSHHGHVHGMAYNAKKKQYASVDRTQMRLWSTQNELRAISFPSRTVNFILAIAYMDDKHIYVASALDGTLILYDCELNPINSFYMQGNTIRCLVYDQVHQQVLCGYDHGLQAWSISGDCSETYDRGWIKNVNYVLTNNKKFVHHAKLVEKLVLNSRQNRVYAIQKKDFYIFCTKSGQLLFSVDKLCPCRINDLIFHESSHYIVAALENSNLAIITPHPKAIVNILRGHTEAVNNLFIHQPSDAIVSGSKDGTIRLWDVEQAQEIHCHDAYADIKMLKHFNGAKLNELVCEMQSELHILELNYVFRELHSMPSKIISIQRTSYKEHASIMTIGMNMDIHVCSIQSVNDTMPLVHIAEQVVVHGYEYNPMRHILYVLLDDDHTIYIYDNSQAQCFKLLDACILSHDITCISWFTSEPLFTTLQGRMAEKCKVTFHHHNEKKRACKADWLACGTSTGKILIFNPIEPSGMAHVVEAHDEYSILQIMHSNATSQFTTIATDGCFKAWSLSPIIKFADCTLHDPLPTCIKASELLQLVICGFEDGFVEIFDYHLSEIDVYRNESNHAASVVAADFSEKENICVTASIDCTIKVWTQEKQLLKELALSMPILNLCFVSGDRLLVAQSNILYILSKCEILPESIPMRTRRTAMKKSNLASHSAKNRRTRAKKKVNVDVLRRTTVVHQDAIKALSAEASPAHSMPSPVPEVDEPPSVTKEKVATNRDKTLLPSTPKVLILEAPVLRPRKQQTLKPKEQPPIQPEQLPTLTTKVDDQELLNPQKLIAHDYQPFVEHHQRSSSVRQPSVCSVDFDSLTINTPLKQQPFRPKTKLWGSIGALERRRSTRRSTCSSSVIAENMNHSNDSK